MLAQSHPDWALRVIDDGSTDTTAEVASRFTDPRISVVRQDNAGVAAARNRGMAAADGDALLFLDADDWLAPDALARLASTLADTPTAVAAHAPFRFVAESASPLPSPLPPTRPRHGTGRRNAAPRDFLRPILERNPFVNGGHVLIRRAAAARAGGFRPGLAYGEDWEYWLRLALQGPFVRAPGRSPVLFARQRRSGAYLRMAADPAAFRPCMEAIFGNPDLIARLGAAETARLRARAEAENHWIAGRELVRHGRGAAGRALLRRALVAKPSAKRAALLAAAHALPLLPPALRGPFRPYFPG